MVQTPRTVMGGGEVTKIPKCLILLPKKKKLLGAPLGNDWGLKGHLVLSAQLRGGMQYILMSISLPGKTGGGPNDGNSRVGATELTWQNRKGKKYHPYLMEPTVRKQKKAWKQSLSIANQEQEGEKRGVIKRLDSFG